MAPILIQIASKVNTTMVHFATSLTIIFSDIQTYPTNTLDAIPVPIKNIRRSEKLRLLENRNMEPGIMCKRLPNIMILRRPQMSLSRGNKTDPRTRPEKNSEPKSPNSLLGAHVKSNCCIQLFRDLFELSLIRYSGIPLVIFADKLEQKSTLVHFSHQTFFAHKHS